MSSNHHIKLFIFDLGKVLVDFDFSVAVKRIEKLCPVNPLKLAALFQRSELAEHWDKGILPPEQFYQWVQKEMNFPVGIEEFIPIWNEIFSENEEMIFLAKSLKHNYQVVVLSNTNPWHARYLEQRYSWLKDFDDFIASCDVHLLKPDTRIFDLVLKKRGAMPSETIYIDDIEKNVEGAMSLGINGLVFKSFPSLKKDLLSRGIIWNA